MPRCRRRARRVFWALRGMKKDLARREQFWAATNDNLAAAYRTLEERSEEGCARPARALLQLNLSLEQRVAKAGRRIVGRARQIEALNLQLQQRVHERSRELAAALHRLAGDQRLRPLGSRRSLRRSNAHSPSPSVAAAWAPSISATIC